jgi:hypothetical protein
VISNRLSRLTVVMLRMLQSYIFDLYLNAIPPSAARLNGFEKDLGLHGTQFATVLAIYFVGYVLMQVPSFVELSSHHATRVDPMSSNMLLSYIKKPSWYLPGSMIIWGLISVLTGTSRAICLTSRH